MIQDYEFYTRGGRILSAPFYVWGIVNCTPNSFFDGGLYFSAEKSFAQAKKLWLDGAHIIDLGGASSRPGAEDISAEMEWERLVRVIPEILKISQENDCKKVDFGKDFQIENKFSRPLLSVDTWRTEVAKKALLAGVDIINDVSAFSWEEDLLEIITEYKPGYVLMHSQGRPENMQKNPQYLDVVSNVYEFFEKKMNKLVQKGLPEKNIILDFGIGFGKKLEHNIKLLQNVEKFNTLGRPILLGISNKSLFADLFGLDKSERGSITQVCSALMSTCGVRHHRVHDVLATRHSLTLQYILKKC